jgi:hypothetical protein
MSCGWFADDLNGAFCNGNTVVILTLTSQADDAAGTAARHLLH